MKFKINFFKKPASSGKRTSDFVINHIGELFVLFFILVFSLGFFVFWKYAWSVSNFQAHPRATSQTIPHKTLEGSIQYTQDRNRVFLEPLEPLNIRDPFIPGGGTSSTSNGTTP